MAGTLYGEAESRDTQCYLKVFHGEQVLIDVASLEAPDTRPQGTDG